MLNKILNNLRQRIKADDNMQLITKLQCLKKDEIIVSQYESLSLMSKINQDEDYLKEAKEVALRILQSTLYQMVDKIESCKTEVCTIVILSEKPGNVCMISREIAKGNRA